MCHVSSFLFFLINLKRIYFTSGVSLGDDCRGDNYMNVQVSADSRPRSGDTEKWENRDPERDRVASEC